MVDNVCRQIEGQLESSETTWKAARKVSAAENYKRSSVNKTVIHAIARS